MTAWIDQLTSAFNAHDAAGVGEFMTADCEYVYWRDDAWVTIRGRGLIVGMLDSLDKEWSSDFTLMKTYAVVTEHGFAVEYNEWGTQDRGPSPSGLPF